MSGIMQMLLAAFQRVTDPFFEYVTLLLPGNGTNGAQNNTFLDSSTNAFSITRNGNTTQGTFSPFSQTGWSNYFDGTGDYLTAGATSNFNFLHNSSALFTIEGWIYVPALGSGPVIFGTNSGTSSQVGTLFWIETTGELRLLIGRGSGGSPVVDATSTATVSVNQWCHVAVTYDQSQASSNCKFYINGTAAGTANKTANAPSASNSAYPGTINAFGTSAAGACYLSSIRVNNSVVYASAFTPSTTPLTAITNTQLLTCQSNRFIDNSTNAFAITRNGDVSVQAFSPFNPTAAWSAATNGGSGYFDGSGDYLSLSYNSAFDITSGDFTVELWVYRTVGSVEQYLFSQRQDSPSRGWEFRLNNTNVAQFFFVGGSSITGSGTIPTNTWTHLAVTRSSNTVRLFINGTQDASATFANGTATTSALYLGYGTTGGGLLTGYISNARIVKGTAVYTAAFTPPTAPLTAITNTSLLCNFTNAGIYDATSKNDLETVGNAQISTTQSKFGGSSMYFDGTGDWLSRPASLNFAFGTGDFTIEMWAYPTALEGGSGWGFVSHGPSATSGYWMLEITANQFYWQASGIANRIVTSASGFTLNNWHHIALCRVSGTVTLYLNGTSLASASDTTNYNGSTSGFLLIGESYNGTNAIGYINDLRITKGIARYTSTFTPPAAAFPVL